MSLSACDETLVILISNRYIQIELPGAAVLPALTISLYV